MKPRLLDLFSGAGGCSVGYARAGFDVTGVDNRPMPRYPFQFVEADAFEVMLDRDYLAQFDVIHASPPCQDHSPLSALVGKHGTGWMLDACLNALMAQPALFVIENVAAANLRSDFLLCGGMFGLRTYRHRRFAIDPRRTMLLSPPEHPRHVIKTSTKKRRRDLEAGMHISITGDVSTYLGPVCMGIDWMNGDELSQAIPPAYTEFIGEQLLEHLRAAA